MLRRQPSLLACVLVSVIALVGAGCGSSTATRSTNTGNRAGPASASTGGSTRAVKQEKALKFAECVRAHGVPHFPDPDAAGNFNFGVDVSAATFTAAVDACKALQPPGSLSSQRSPKQQSAALRFARCVRSHGVPDFPDPDNGQPLIDTDHIPSSNSPSGMSILNAATHTCGSSLGADAPQGGESGG